MLIETLSWVRNLRRLFSRKPLSLRLLGSECTRDHATRPGLLMVQIDGFGRRQLETALEKGKMPFLKSLLEKEDYRLESLYSGMPSTTPAVQGELFYGIPSVVPSFGFQKDGRLTSMLDGDTAREIQSQLADRGEPLLAGGTAYSDIYDGGAKEAGFCVTRMGAAGLFPQAGIPARIGVLGLHAFMFARVGVLAGIEVLLALWDFARGVNHGHSLPYEFAFLPKRVVIGVLLRELVTLGASLDATRGVPVVHCNFLGYDEQSHRRGPASRFAHWSLKGIDDAIKRIARTAHRSGCRDYDLWIYSDHGQMKTTPYESLYGRPLQKAVDEVFEARGLPGVETLETQGGETEDRSRLLGGDLLQRAFSWPSGKPKLARIPVASMGPVAHVYSPRSLSDRERFLIAEDLVVEAHVPCVLYVDSTDTSHLLVNRNGSATRERIVDVFVENHPFGEYMEADLNQLLRHPDAGDWVLVGWHPEADAVTFAHENGAHGGPGPEEVHAFALTPADAPLEAATGQTLRPGDLRKAALRVLNRADSSPAATPLRGDHKDGVIRLLTYNVHSCRGLDGKHSPERIARVIARYRPDVVALQEIDVGRARTEGRHQAEEVAQALDMQFHFHPTIVIEDEQYGNAILSRLPMRLTKADSLPGKPGCEPRGALWVEVQLPGDNATLQIVNTHLGLRSDDRLRQIGGIFGDEWIRNSKCRPPVAVCGDFNALPNSRAYAELTSHLRDACRACECQPQSGIATWMGLGRIDHVFCSDGITVHRVFSPSTRLARISSDHRPLIADIALP